MPLRCLDDAGRSVDASTLTAIEWTALTATNRHVRHLRTLCCGAPLVLKTSRLGTRFFAHLALGGCASGDESPEHLHLKALAITAARAAGWTAEAEVAGTTPAGEPWRADVLARRGRLAVAVEVQWSPQTDDETARRQARYAAAGIRGLWLFRQRRFAATQAVPAVRVAGSLKTGLTALGLPVAAVLAAVFAGRLRFGLPAGVTARARVVGVVMACWRCGALNRPVASVELAHAGSRCAFSPLELGDAPALCARVLPRLPADPARGRLRVRWSAMAKRAYLANGCFACDALLGDHYLAGHGDSRFFVVTSDLPIDAAAAAEIAAFPAFEPVWGVAPPAANA